MADGQVAPGAIRVAGDGLDGKSRGESESGVALVGRSASEADVGGRDSEAVVDLRHRAAINLKSGVGCLLKNGQENTRVVATICFTDTQT